MGRTSFLALLWRRLRFWVSHCFRGMSSWFGSGVAGECSQTRSVWRKAERRSCPEGTLETLWWIGATQPSVLSGRALLMTAHPSHCVAGCYGYCQVSDGCLVHFFSFSF